MLTSSNVNPPAQIFHKKGAKCHKYGTQDASGWTSKQ